MYDANIIFGFIYSIQTAMSLKRLILKNLRVTISCILKNARKAIFGLLIFIAVFIYIQYHADIALTNIQKACIGAVNKENQGVSREMDKADDISSVVKVAKTVSKFNGSVLVSVVNDAFLPFAYSWLCNTKSMNVHKSVLVITTDVVSKQRLNTDWPDVSVVRLDLNIPPGNQEYSRAGYVQIMIKRTEILLELLKADLEILLLEFDFMWFSNPIPRLQKMKGVDFLVNPVSSEDVVFNGGFLYMFPTERSKVLWKRLTAMMRELGQQLEKKSNTFEVSPDDNDQVYFSTLIKQRYANVTTGELPLDTYADGKWYELTEQERKSKPAVVISNNFVLGNANKIQRAKKWRHWFLRDDCTCDLDLVNRMVHR